MTTLQLITDSIGVLTLFYWLWRITHPMHCTCGRLFWRRRAMYRHQAQSHKYTEMR